jgi:hypothetical protein
LPPFPLLLLSATPSLLFRLPCPPSSSPSSCYYYNITLTKRPQYITTINAFAKYDNVLAYNVGNEVLTFNFTNAAPFLKAAARDVRAYL